ncbi:S-layer homology domain-containing protein, partial [Candidatus Peregrinibacteria bacterium]|nr:S-layer homology domain-containing protein [Candidatus Peregrinibacteria bacterium]
KKILTLFILGLFVGLSSSAMASASSFYDVDSTHKNIKAIEFLKNRKIIQGYPDGSFKPENTVNRAELMKILIGESLPDDSYENCFNDVKNEWFASYVCYAKSQTWIEGYSDNTFKPAQTVNRAEAIKMAIEVFGVDLPSVVDTNPFSDTEHDTWFAKYVQAGKTSGLFDENTQVFRPADGMTRGDISEIIYRLLVIKELQVEKYDQSLDSQILSDEQEEEEETTIDLPVTSPVSVLPPEIDIFYFSPPEKDFIAHLEMDVQPWIEWGISASDTSTKEERIQAIAETALGRVALDYLGYDY